VSETIIFFPTSESKGAAKPDNSPARDRAKHLLDQNAIWIIPAAWKPDSLLITGQKFQIENRFFPG
jgi:hypothetical protein